MFQKNRSLRLFTLTFALAINTLLLACGNKQRAGAGNTRGLIVSVDKRAINSNGHFTLQLTNNTGKSIPSNILVQYRVDITITGGKAKDYFFMPNNKRITLESKKKTYTFKVTSVNSIPPSLQDQGSLNFLSFRISLDPQDGTNRNITITLQVYNDHNKPVGKPQTISYHGTDA